MALVLFSFSEEQAKLAARKYARIVQKLGFPVSLYRLYNNHCSVVLVTKC